MLRTDVAYVVNSTPRYYFLLKGHFGLMDIYARGLQWPVYIGSEVPEKVVEYPATCIPLLEKDSGFWESRVATVEALPNEIKYVLPMQEDFLLERKVDSEGLEKILDYMDAHSDVVSARLMPCPGPVSKVEVLEGWSQLSEKDSYLFVFQAALWRREAYVSYLKAVIEKAKSLYIGLDSITWNKMAVSENLAENGAGREIFLRVFKGKKHLAWIRPSSRPNAVYDSLWPYRPTAVVKGVFQDWARDLLLREGF
jgi:hypothetical protein